MQRLGSSWKRWSAVHNDAKISCEREHPIARPPCVMSFRDDSRAVGLQACLFRWCNRVRLVRRKNKFILVPGRVMEERFTLGAGPGAPHTKLSKTVHGPARERQADLREREGRSQGATPYGPENAVSEVGSMVNLGVGLAFTLHIAVDSVGCRALGNSSISRQPNPQLSSFSRFWWRSSEEDGIFRPSSATQHLSPTQTPAYTARGS